MPLVVCVGNPLLGDDAVAWHVAEVLRAGAVNANARVVTCHQLVPEMAQDVAEASVVVIVDARDDGSPPGAVSVCRLPPRAGGDAPAASHAFGPADLLALAAELFHARPDVVLVTVSVAATEAGTGLSPVVEDSLPAAVDAVRRAVGLPA